MAVQYLTSLLAEVQNRIMAQEFKYFMTSDGNVRGDNFFVVTFTCQTKSQNLIRPNRKGRYILVTS